MDFESISLATRTQCLTVGPNELCSVLLFAAELAKISQHLLGFVLRPNLAECALLI